MGNKLTKDELTSVSRRLRGKRAQIAIRAGVTESVVNCTFEGRYQNEKVLTVFRDMLKEQEEEKINPVILELREMVRELE